MEARSQFAVKLLPSLADFAFLMPMAFLFGRMEGVKTLIALRNELSGAKRIEADPSKYVDLTYYEKAIASSK